MALQKNYYPTWTNLGADGVKPFVNEVVSDRIFLEKLGITPFEFDGFWEQKGY
jgi:hypothetical protein